MFVMLVHLVACISVPTALLLWLDNTYLYPFYGGSILGFVYFWLWTDWSQVLIYIAPALLGLTM